MFLQRCIYNISEDRDVGTMLYVNVDTTHTKRHQIWTTAVTTTSVLRKSNNDAMLQVDLKRL